MKNDIGDTPLHILVKLHEQEINVRADKKKLFKIQALIELLSPFCEKSLTIRNNSGQNPRDIAGSDTIKAILSENFNMANLDDCSSEQFDEANDYEFDEFADQNCIILHDNQQM